MLDADGASLEIENSVADFLNQFSQNEKLQLTFSRDENSDAVKISVDE